MAKQMINITLKDEVEMAELIAKYSQCIGPTGYECMGKIKLEKTELPSIATFFAKRLANILKNNSCADVFIDENTGQVYAKIGCKAKNPLRVLVPAHVDEIAFIVRKVKKLPKKKEHEKKKVADKPMFELEVGFLGGHFLPSVIGKKVIILHKTSGTKMRSQWVAYHGVISGHKPPHLLTPAERAKAPKKENIKVFLPATSKRKIDVGDLVVFDTKPAVDRTTGWVLGKSIDNRYGVAVAEKVATLWKTVKDKKLELWIVGTTKEELGLKGIRSCAFTLNPDICLVSDVTTKDTSTPGSGISITILEAEGRGTVVDERVLTLLKNVAKKFNIPYKCEVGKGGMTDGTILELTNQSIACGVVSVSTDPLHAPTEAIFGRDALYAAFEIFHALKELNNDYSKHSFYPRPHKPSILDYVARKNLVYFLKAGKEMDKKI
jgi:endoglucanase